MPSDKGTIFGAVPINRHIRLFGADMELGKAIWEKISDTEVAFFCWGEEITTEEAEEYQRRVGLANRKLNPFALVELVAEFKFKEE